MESPPDKDYFTALPEEALLEICSFLPAAEFLAVIQTCKKLNRITHPHEQQLCNMLIIEDPIRAQAAKLLNSTDKKGWLTPTHPSIHREEQRLHLMHFHGFTKDAVSEIFAPVIFPAICTPACGPNFHLRLKLTQPGPQFYRFLKQHASSVTLNAVKVIDEAARMSLVDKLQSIVYKSYLHKSLFFENLAFFEADVRQRFELVGKAEVGSASDEANA